MSDIKQFYELRKDLQKLLGKLTNIIIDLEYNNDIIKINPPNVILNNSSDSSDSSDSTNENSEDDEIACNVKYAINTINSDLKFYIK
jgi:hypothetical protein